LKARLAAREERGPKDHGGFCFFPLLLFSSSPL
jgi:hypothetical protein